MVHHAPLPWSTMANPYFLQNRLTMGDHGQHYCSLTFMADQGQTMVISLPWYITTMVGNLVQPW